MRIESSILIPLGLIVLLASVYGNSIGCDAESTHSEPKGVNKIDSNDYAGCETFKSEEQIEIYRPNGLRVTQNSENLLGFGINVYITPKNTKYSTYRLNTTEVDPNGKHFILYEPKAEIREGNKFDYSIKKQYKNGSSHWYECKSFRVKESSIKEIPHGQIDFYNLHAVDEINKELQTTPQINTTVKESAPITNTFVLAENTDVTTESKLKEFIITRLTALLPSVDWNNTITEVFRWNSKFSFDVKTAEEKRKILRLLEKNEGAAEVVFDFDNMETSDNNEDYDSSTAPSL